MDPREALDITIKSFKLTAADIARNSGVTVQMLSRYRKKRQDMNSLNVFQVIRALPHDAQHFFLQLSLMNEGIPDLSEKIDLAQSEAEQFNLVRAGMLSEGCNASLLREFLIKSMLPASKTLLETPPIETSEENREIYSTNSDELSNLEGNASQNLDLSHYTIESMIEKLVLEYLDKHLRSKLYKELKRLSLIGIESFSQHQDEKK